MQQAKRATAAREARDPKFKKASDKARKKFKRST